SLSNHKPVEVSTTNLDDVWEARYALFDAATRAGALADHGLRDGPEWDLAQARLEVARQTFRFAIGEDETRAIARIAAGHKAGSVDSFTVHYSDLSPHIDVELVWSSHV